MVIKMKRMWILVLAILLAIPATATVVSAGGHQNVHPVYFGHFEYSNGVAKGKFVSFKIDAKSGVIENYTVGNITIFEKITYENSTMGHVKISGARLFYYGVATPFGWNSTHKNGYMWRVIMAHDNPVGVLHIVTHGQDILRYKLADGVNATLSNNTIILSGKASAYLFTSSSLLSLKNNTIYIKTKDNGTTSVIFIEPANGNIPKKMKNMEIKGLQEQKLGGEMYIEPNGTDFVNYTYGMHANLLMEKRNHIQIHVSADGVNGGRIIVVNVNRTMLNYNSSMHLVVKFDGKEINETSVESILNGSVQAIYAISYNNDTLSIAIYLPHFSEHVIDVESEASTSGVNGGGNVNNGGNSNSGSSNENSNTPAGISTAMLWGIVAAIIVIVIVAAVGVKKSKSH